MAKSIALTRFPQAAPAAADSDAAGQMAILQSLVVEVRGLRKERQGRAVLDGIVAHERLMECVARVSDVSTDQTRRSNQAVPDRDRVPFVYTGQRPGIR